MTCAPVAVVKTPDTGRSREFDQLGGSDVDGRSQKTLMHIDSGIEQTSFTVWFKRLRQDWSLERLVMLTIAFGKCYRSIQVDLGGLD